MNSSGIEAVGIPITQEVRLKVDWDELSRALFVSAAQGFGALMGDLPSLGHAATSMASVAKSIKMETPTGEKAWHLIALSFAWAFDELRNREHFDGIAAEAAIREALEVAKVQISQREYTVTSSFLYDPVSLTLYRLLRDKFVERKHTFRNRVHEDDEALKARFDIAFTRGVFEVWSKRPEVFQSISQVLQAPGLAASEFNLQWEAYRQSLIYEFEVRPIFGQENTKIALSQLYIPLRAKWFEVVEGKVSRQTGRVLRKINFVWIDEELDKWISSAPVDDHLRLIGGSPGSGKSTTVKALARRLAENPNVRPLFIPLQHIDISLDLRDAIDRYFTDRTQGAFRQGPLSRESLEGGPPVVLIFDGLDELARPGSEGADEISRLFVSKLTALLGSIRGSSQKAVRIVVTGRLPAFQTVKKYASANENKSYEVVGFRPQRPMPAQEANLGIRQTIAFVDQRPEWWVRYSSVFSLPKEVPSALSDPRFSGITNEPLLCYLLALSGYAADNWEAAAKNRNLIYEKLIDEIWRRGWGDFDGLTNIHNRRGPGKTLSKHGFNRLMETIALSAWWGGELRVSSEISFFEARDMLKTNNEWEDFKRDNGPDMANLAMNFYLQASETEHRGFEFTHRSFGEYLTARALINIALDIMPLIDRRVELAALEWFRATCKGSMSIEVLEYLRDEIRLSESRDANSIDTGRLKSQFEKLAQFAIDDGLPAHKESGCSWRGAEALQANSERVIWAMLNSAVLALSESQPQSTVSIDWPDERSLSRLILRLSNADDEIDEPILQCLSYIQAGYQDLSHVNLFEASFVGANLKGSLLKGANCGHADFTESDLTNADLDDGRFQRANFKSANLSGASLVDAHLAGALLSEARLDRTVISERTLDDPELHMTEDMIAKVEINYNVRGMAERGPFVSVEATKLRNVDLSEAIVSSPH